MYARFITVILTSMEVACEEVRAENHPACCTSHEVASLLRYHVKIESDADHCEGGPKQANRIGSKHLQSGVPK